MTVELVYDPAIEDFRFPEGHPLVPERFSLAVALMRAWSLIAESPVFAEDGRALLVTPTTCTDDDLLLVHSAEYVRIVKSAGHAGDATELGGAGIGNGDVPVFEGMHEAASLACGASIRALRDVVEGRTQKAFSPAGGLHHAHRSRAAGFCVYNDPAVAIARLTVEYPGLRVAYIDLDAHHGDGVQEAFERRSDVLTLSVHASPAFQYPGTGWATDVGSGEGEGYALNVPMPQDATDECYALVMERVVTPALHCFAPDVVLAQLGADPHRNDPIGRLGMTVKGMSEQNRALFALCDEVCGGRIAALGGGGYDSYDAVPRTWACTLAEMLRLPVPEEIPQQWRRLAQESAHDEGFDPPALTFAEYRFLEDAAPDISTVDRTIASIEEVTSVSPLLR